ncbi:hypothetical protein ACQUQP_13040 [Marinobacterium sp. YM272]|uniref:hypothetical protein n=1 Tax=Marinobacterium sp. YM272 TaxID=3421654 RepID=UPI003D7FA5CD
MNFAKEDKGFVIRWMDRQFATDDTFPAVCCRTHKGKKTVSRDHVLAYREWSALGHKRSQIQAWIDRWLDDEEVQMLKQALKDQSQPRREVG